MSTQLDTACLRCCMSSLCRSANLTEGEKVISIRSGCDKEDALVAPMLSIRRAHES